MKEPDTTPWGLMLALALVLLTPPLLSLVNHRTPVLGTPLVLVYLFAVWGGLIAFSTLYRPRE